MSVNDYFRLLVFFICLFPFIYIPYVFNASEYPKFIALIVVGVASGIYLLYDYKQVWKEMRKNPFVALIVLFLLWAFFTNSVGIDSHTSFFGSKLRMQGFIATLMCLFIFLTLLILPKREQRQKRLLFFLSRAVFILCLLTISQGIALIAFSNHAFFYFGKVQFPLGNPHFLGGIIATLSPLFIFQEKRLMKRIRNSIIIFASIGLTGSKTAILAFCIGLCVCFFLTNKSKVRWIGIVLASILATSSIIKVVVPSLFLSHFPSSLWDSREIIWRNAWESIRQSPLIGFGQENTILALMPVYNLVYDSAHNIFLEYLLWFGFPGLFLFLLVLIAAFRYSPNLIRTMLAIWLVVASFNPISLAQFLLLWVLFSYCRVPNR